MYILVPWKPVVLVWGLLSATISFGFVASSVLQGKDPFAPENDRATPRHLIVSEDSVLLDI